MNFDNVFCFVFKKTCPGISLKRSVHCFYPLFLFQNYLTKNHQNYLTSPLRVFLISNLPVFELGQ